MSFFMTREIKAIIFNACGYLVPMSPFYFNFSTLQFARPSTQILLSYKVIIFLLYFHL